MRAYTFTHGIHSHTLSMENFIGLIIKVVPVYKKTLSLEAL